MRVRELIDFLRVQDPEAEIELTIVESDPSDESTLGVTRYPIVEVITVPTEEDEDGNTTDDGTEMVWLVGGEQDDVDDFIDAISEDDFDED